ALLLRIDWGLRFPIDSKGAAMKSFLQRFGSLVSGVLHGFDRLRLRGSKRQLCNPGGFFSFLSHVQVPLQHYKSYAQDTTLSLCKAIETQAKQVGLYRYLNNSQRARKKRRYTWQLRSSASKG